MLQEALKKLGFDIKVDGIIGPVTLQTLFMSIEEFGREKVLETFRKVRALQYAREVKHDPSQAAFIEGWIKRR